MKWSELSDETCPIARGLSVIGDRWTLLVLREAFRGQRRFEPIQERLGITRHVLADRLRKLEAAGVLERVKYQDRPERFEYRLTPKGIDLQPLMMTLVTWAETHMPRPEGPRLRYRFKETGDVIEPVLADARTGKRITSRNVRAEHLSYADEGDGGDGAAAGSDRPSPD